MKVNLTNNSNIIEFKYLKAIEKSIISKKLEHVFYDNVFMDLYGKPLSGFIV